MSKSSGQAGKLSALTGARFFAAFAVVLLHFGGPLFEGAPAALETLRTRGFTAVSFFFALSGFILAYHYLRPAALGALDRRQFWIARVARVYPTYLLGLALLVPLAVWPELDTGAFGQASVKAKAVTLLSHLSMTQAFLPPLTLSWNIPGWSIGVEMFFYALFPFIAALAMRLSQRAVPFAMVGLWLLSMSLASAYHLVDPDGLGATSIHSKGPFLVALKFSPLARLPELVFGVLLGRLFLERRPSETRARFLGPSALLALALALALLPAPYPLLHNGLLLPLCGAAIFGLAEARGWLRAALSLRPLEVLGEASYALYILQLPLMFFAKPVALWLGLDVESALFRAGYLAFAVAASIVTFYAFELPAQRSLRALLLRATARTAPAPVVAS